MIGMIPGVQQMGLLMKFMGDASGAVGAMDKVSGAITGTVKVVAGLTTAAVGLGVAMGGVIMKMGSAGSATKMAREEFYKMTSGMNIDGKELIETLGRIAGGTVKDTELIQQANLALLLGGKQLAEALPILMGIAAEKARALSMPITQAFSDIVRGVGRASPLILDNLGIIVDNVAAQKELAISLGYVKEATESVADEIEEHNAKLEELTFNLELAKIKQSEMTGEEKESVKLAAERKLLKLEEQIDAERKAIEELLPKLGEQSEALKADTKRLSKEEKTLALVNAIQEKYGKTVDISGDRILTAGEKTQTMTTQLGNMKDRLNEAVIPALEILLSTLTPVINKIVDGSEKVIAFANSFFEAFKEGGPTEAFRLFFEKAKKIIGEAIPKIVAFIRDATPVIIKQLLEWGEALISWIAPKIPIILSKLGELIVKIWQWIKEQVPKLVSNLVGWGKAFIDGILPKIPETLKKLKELGQKIWDWITDEAVPTLVKKLGGWAETFVSWLETENVPGKLVAKLFKLQAKLVSWILNDAIPAVVGAISGLGNAFTNWATGGDRKPSLLARLISWFKGTYIPGLIKGFKGVTDVFVNWLKEYDVINKVLKGLGDLAKSVWNWIKETVSILKEKLNVWAIALAVGVVAILTGPLGIVTALLIGLVVAWAGSLDGVMTKLKEKLSQIVKSITDFIKETVLVLMDTLKELGQGIWNWIVETVPIILEKLGGWAHVFVDWVTEEDVLGKLITKLGDFLSGIIHWILADAVPAIFKAVLSLVQAIIGAFTGEGPEAGGEKSLGQKILDYLLTIPGKIWGALVQIGSAIARGLVEGILQIFGVSAEDAKLVVDEIVGWFEGLIETVGDVIDEFKAVFGWHSILGILNDFVTALGPLMDLIMKPFTIFVGLIKTVLGVISDVIFAIAGLFGIDMPGRGGGEGVMEVKVVGWTTQMKFLLDGMQSIARYLVGQLSFAPGVPGFTSGITIINNWPEGIGAADKTELAELIEFVTYRSIKRVFNT